MHANRYELGRHVNKYSTPNDLANTRTNLQYNIQGFLTIRNYSGQYKHAFKRKPTMILLTAIIIILQLNQRKSIKIPTYKNYYLATYNCHKSLQRGRVGGKHNPVNRSKECS